ncbi:MAG: PA14 domain-containing protein, partial [Verrucomicrobia bacterium]|nr:PA14 domain-containing protein [Verrucomicrobiota bacterium]
MKLFNASSIYMKQSLRFFGMFVLAVAIANLETAWAAITSTGGTQINWATQPPSSVTAGTTFQVSWTTVGTVLQTKVQVDETDPLNVSSALGQSTRNVTVLSSGGFLTAPTKRGDGSTITSPVVVKYVAIALDESTAVASSDIVSVTVNPPQPSGADLLVDQGAVTVSPSPILAGGNITVSFVIRNGGSGTAQASTTRVKVVGAGENVIVDQTFSVDVINAGATLNQSHPLTIPATAAAGTYGIEIKLDDANSAGQATNERVNDGATGSVVVTTPPTGPDLVFSPTSVTVGPSPVLAGGNITVGFRAANVGLANAGASTTRIRVEDSIQNLITEATFSLPALNAGTGIDQNLQLTIPAGTPAASFSVVVKLDDTNEAGQTSGERNNDVLSGSVTVTTPASGPDLAFSPTSVTVGPSSVVAGGTFTVSYRVANIGLASAAVSTTRVRVEGPNQTLIVESTFTVPGLNAGAGADQSHLLSIPSGTSTGNFTVLVKLDDADQAGQASSERGNDSISGSVTVSAPPSGPDLVVDQGAVSVTPGTVVVGGNIEVSFTIRNLGLGAAAPSMTRVQAVEPGGNIISEKMFAVGSIGSGASLSQNHQLTIPLNAPAGQYEVRVHLDSTETSGQTPNERSNDQSQSGFLVNSGLTISAISDQTIFKNGATPAIIFAVNDPLADASATIFDNTTTSLDRSYFPGNEIEFGDQIFLAGGDRSLAEFQFQTFLSSNASGNETAELIIHANDGGTDAHPGTVLFQSGKFPLTSGFQIITVPDLLVNVPNSVTWTVKLGGIEAGEDAGLLLFDPPSVGASLDDFWRLGVDGTWSTFLIDNGATPANFWARAISPTGLSIDRSTTKPELVPVGNIVVEGLGINRIVTVTPLLNQVGTATITLTVNNGRGGSASESFLVTVIEPPAGSGTGLRGDYFTDTSLNDPAFVRLDPKVDFDWSDVGPDPFLGGAFSVRWTGQVEPEFSETYTFYTVSDDGVRLFVNNQLVIDNFTAHGPTEDRGTISLAGGQKVDIVLEYFEDFGPPAVISLSWSSLHVQREIVPSIRLFPPAGGNTPPVISSLQNKLVFLPNTPGTIPFLISDFESSVASLNPIAVSLNQSFLPDSAITVSGTGTTRSMAVVPPAGQEGTAGISVSVADEGNFT